MEAFLKPIKRNTDEEKRQTAKFKQTVNSFNSNFIGISKIRNFCDKIDKTSDFLLQSGDAWNDLFIKNQKM